MMKKNSEKPIRQHRESRSGIIREHHRRRSLTKGRVRSVKGHKPTISGQNSKYDTDFKRLLKNQQWQGEGKVHLHRKTHKY